MTGSRGPVRPDVDPPAVQPPAPFVERRSDFRRIDDRTAREERVLLARILDILASGEDAETRLARVLRLLADTGGARRAAVVTDDDERRVAVSASHGEDPDAADALGAWLDATAARSRARRAAAAPAPIYVAGEPPEDETPPATTLRDELGETGAGPGGAGHGLLADVEPVEPDMDLAGVATDGRAVYRRLAISGTRISLGFEFADERVAARLADRLPPGLTRHAAVALALVTSQLAVERELGRLRAEEVERTGYVSTVAHELRTPLTGLSGYLDLILEGKVADENVQREFLERGRDIVQTMAGLVGDLLELSRLEAGSLSLDIEPFSVADVGGRVAAGLLPIALDRGIQLRTDFPPKLRAATGDRRRIEQIVTNLAGNALKFTPSGGTVELAAWFDGPVATIVVRDEGPGIPAEDRGRIFERFYRLPGHERVTGTGLGLAIARDLARAMGGDLDVASVVGSGSSFVLVLPGPTPIETGQVDAVLARALESEVVELEERAVLRALAAAGRGPAEGRAERQAG